MNARRPSSFRSITGVLAACVVALGVAVGHLGGQGQSSSLQLLTRDGRRTIPITVSGAQEMVALDDLASAFQLGVRDDGGAITVAYKGRTIVLTPDQTIASVAGRLISLSSAPVRTGNRWFVPLDFIVRALGPIYDSRLDLRRAARLLVVGDLRVPRVIIRHDTPGASARVTFDIAPATTVAVTQQGSQRLLVRFDADALDTAVPTFQPGGFVQAIRVTDAANVAIDLGPRFGTFRSTTQPIENGTRVTIDVSGAQTETSTPAPPQAAPPTNPAGTVPSLRTVAIDAGHGGEDAGARGAAGAIEKDIALSVSRRLKALLEGRLGVRVVMTREDDRDVPIESRSAAANNNKADLFISLHANASFRPEVAGAAVYTAWFSQTDLSSEGGIPERLPVFGGGLRTIEVVPWSLAQIPHRGQSERFAQIVTDALTGHVPLASRPVEHAPLRVLESTNMPAVLLEMGYLTNAEQETALGGNDVQNAIAQALLDAVVRYRDDAAGAPEGGAR